MIRRFTVAEMKAAFHAPELRPRAARRVNGSIPEGERNVRLTRIAGALRRQGMFEEAIVEALLAINRTQCDTPLPDAELRAIAASVARYPAGPGPGPQVDSEVARISANAAGSSAESALVFVSNLTDVANAKRLVTAHGGDLRYVKPSDHWLAWGGRRWAKDETGEVERRAKDSARGIYNEAAAEPDADERKRLAKHAAGTETAARIRAMIELARSEPGIPALPEQFDRDPYLFNVLNGTVDLRTGELLDHRREDMLTKLAPVDYKENASAPIWLEFLLRIFNRNEQMIAFIRRAVGYSLTGVTTEQVLFILYGSGANGKTTLRETIHAALGDYALTTPSETLLKKRQSGIPNDIAALRGARFVTASETADGRRLDEARIKDLTGGDTISARFMHGEFFQFKPVCKVWLSTNHKPVIRGTDNAIWRRIRLIPFDVTIPEDEQDKSLPDKLKQEAPGILAWAVGGAEEWFNFGLGLPDEVTGATRSYRAEMDVHAAFIEECCVVKPELVTPAGELYAHYQRWCQASGEVPTAARSFGLTLSERGFSADKGTGGKRIRRGIGLLESGARGG
ncbi:MAG: primase C-terminal domain-containing protein [Acidobacteria bacterium]|nr:primase C-terminal domain-containing protein [Acidobacteriota bacterium]